MSQEPHEHEGQDHEVQGHEVQGHEGQGGGESHGEGHAGMGERGVTRPMEMMHGDHDQHGGHAMSEEERREMLGMHHKKTLWIYWTLITLALWLLTAPFTFGYLNEEL